MRQHHLISFLFLSLAIGCATEAPRRPMADSISGQTFLKLWEFAATSPGNPITDLFVRDNLVIAYAKNHTGFWFTDQGSFLNRSQIVTGDRRVFPPVVLNDLVAIPTTSSVETFDKLGKLIQSYPMATSIQGPAGGAGAALYFGVSHERSGRLARYNFTARGLVLAWELYTTLGVVAAPAVWNDAIFAGGSDGKVWAITGSRDSLWMMSDGRPAFATSGKITADVQVDEYGVYVASHDRQLYCVDRTTGRVRWSYYAPAPLLEAPFLSSTNVYQPVPNVGLVAIDKTEGRPARAPLWIQPLADRVLSVDATHVYASSGGAIVALDRLTGEVVFRSSRNDFVTFATNPKTPIIYAATRAGTIVAIQPVLRPGTVGETVMNESPQAPLAAAR